MLKHTISIISILQVAAAISKFIEHTSNMTRSHICQHYITQYLEYDHDNFIFLNASNITEHTGAEWCQLVWQSIFQVAAVTNTL